jgi:ribosomal protein S21
LKKTLHKNGLVEWLKVKTLSSNPRTTKKKKKKKIAPAISVQQRNGVKALYAVTP